MALAGREARAGQAQRPRPPCMLMLAALQHYDRLLKSWPSCKSVYAAHTRSSPPHGLAPPSGKIVTQFQSDSLRTDSLVRILNAQPGSPVSTEQNVKSARNRAVSGHFA